MSSIAQALARRPQSVNRAIDTALGFVAGLALLLLIQHGWALAHPPSSVNPLPLWYGGPASGCQLIRFSNTGAEHPGPHPMGYTVDGEWLCAMPVPTATPR